jgi:hypothetical protein
VLGAVGRQLEGRYEERHPRTRDCVQGAAVLALADGNSELPASRGESLQGVADDAAVLGAGPAGEIFQGHPAAPRPLVRVVGDLQRNGTLEAGDVRSQCFTQLAAELVAHQFSSLRRGVARSGCWFRTALMGALWLVGPRH